MSQHKEAYHITSRWLMSHHAICQDYIMVSLVCKQIYMVCKVATCGIYTDPIILNNHDSGICSAHIIITCIYKQTTRINLCG